MELSDYINEKINYRLIWKMWDNLLDKVYAGQSKVSKEEWFEKLAKVTPWVLKPENMRIYTYDLLKELENKAFDLDEIDQPCGHHTFRGV